jgi:hypothetical protein
MISGLFAAIAARSRAPGRADSPSPKRIFISLGALIIAQYGGLIAYHPPGGVALRVMGHHDTVRPVCILLGLVRPG